MPTDRAPFRCLLSAAVLLTVSLNVSQALAQQPAPPAAAGPVTSVEAGPIWNAADANTKCNRVCVAPAKWNGQWRTTIPNKMSTCDCVAPPPPPPPAPVTPPAAPPAAGGNVTSVEAGPIWNAADANTKCARVCVAPAKWNGQWRTTIPNKMSTCDCVAPRVVSVEAGPIWNAADANTKCNRVCAAPAKWNGQWRTTIPNKMSTCDCVTQ